MKPAVGRCARAVIAIASAAAALPASAPAKSSLRASQAAARVPTLDWGPCGPDLELFLCATADVPTDYDDPAGPTDRRS
jgi:hypothetical protein